MKTIIIGLLAMTSMSAFAEISEIHHQSCKVSSLSLTGPESMKQEVEAALSAKGYDLSNQDDGRGLRISMGRQIEACSAQEQREIGNRLQNVVAWSKDAYSCLTASSFKHITIDNVEGINGNQIEASTVYSKGVQNLKLITNKSEQGMKRAIKWALKNTPNCVKAN